MSEYEEINLEAALEKNPIIYKLSLKYIYESLLPKEKVLFVSQATEHEVKVEEYWSDFWRQWKEKVTYSNTPSLVIITNERWIRKWTYWQPDEHSQPVLFTDKNAKQGFIRSMKTGYRWAEPFDDVPHDKHYEREGKTLQEWANSNIRFLPLKEIEVGEKSFWFSNQNDVKKKYVRIEITDTDYTFKHDDGEKLFALLQLAATNNGRINLGMIDKKASLSHGEEIAQRLKAAQELFESKIITESEYQKKREQILSDL